MKRGGASEEYASVPGGTTGLLTKDYKGKQADTPVYKVDTALLAELRAHERQAAEELCQWKAVIEERKMRDATPAAITLAIIQPNTALELFSREYQLILRVCQRPTATPEQ